MACGEPRLTSVYFKTKRKRSALITLIEVKRASGPQIGTQIFQAGVAAGAGGDFAFAPAAEELDGGGQVRVERLGLDLMRPWLLR